MPLTLIQSSGGSTPSSTTPLSDGTAAVGTSTTYARSDHVHPTDSTLAPKNNPTFTGALNAATGSFSGAVTSGGSALITAGSAAATYQPILGFTPYNATNPSGYQTAAQVSAATAANVSGTVSLANGGTGATSASAARTSLGLATVAATGAYADLSAKPTLGGAAALNVGAATGTVAAGDDSRITGALSAATAATTYAPFSSAAYLGQCATRCCAPNAAGAPATATWLMSRSMHFARSRMVNPTLGFANFYINASNSETTIGAGTIKASIEYPAGTFTACTGGTTAFPNGVTLLVCPITIPRGAQFWVRSLQVNSFGVIYTTVASNVADTSEGLIFGTGTATDLTGSGTVPASSGRVLIYAPTLILASTTNPSVLIVGDSRIIGHGDSVTDLSADVGNLPRSIGPVFGYTTLAVEGTSLAQYISNSRTYRNGIVQYFSHVASCLSGADLQVGGATAASVATLRANFAALFPNSVVFGVTMPPTSSSTDTWATTANQTLGTVGALVQGFNTLVRAGIAGEAFYFDLSDAVDPYRSGKWPVSYNPAATSGTAGFATADGQHETPAINMLIRTSAVVKTHWIAR